MKKPPNMSDVNAARNILRTGLGALAEGARHV